MRCSVGAEGRWSIRARWAPGDRLECVVEDNGPGAPAGEVRQGAFGLRAIVRRVELKYPGARVALEGIADDASGSTVGTRATVEIPRASLELGNAGQPA